MEDTNQHETDGGKEEHERTDNGDSGPISETVENALGK